MRWYGVSYYPEHWPHETWAQDAQRMKSAGFNLVRMGDFAWGRLEAEEGRFTLDWLAEAVDLLYAAGLSVLLATPTAGPPAWLVLGEGAEDCRLDYETGGRWQYGGRSLCCVNHPRFLARCTAIAAALGGRFGGHPAVIGWQIDNEPGMYGVRCHCPHCTAGFRAWLEDRFGSIEALNRRLGLVFNASEFRRFDDVAIPRLGQDLHNPGLSMESVRFFSACYARFVEAQAAALREAGAAQPVTANVCHMLSGGCRVQETTLYENLDFVSWDCYPQQFAPDPAPETLGLLHAVARGLKGRPYWLGEQQSGSPFGMAASDPRRIRLWAWQSLIHGAEGLLYFRWRTCRFGGEQNWRGILDHTGRDNEKLSVVSQLGTEIEVLRDRLGILSPTVSAVLLLDPDNADAMSVGANSGAPRMSYRAHAEGWFGALQRLGHAAGIVFEPPDPKTHPLCIAPLLRMVSQDWIGRLRDYVADGGVLVLTCAAATLDPDHVGPPEPVPRGLTDVFGLERIEWSALAGLAVPPKERQGEDAAAWAALTEGSEAPVVGCAPLAPGPYAARSWCDHLRPLGCEIWARYAAGTPAAHAPAATCHSFGRGKAVYVASDFGAPLLDAVCEELTGRNPDAPRLPESGVEAVPVDSKLGRLWAVLNHQGIEAAAGLSGSGLELLTEQRVSHSLRLEPYGVALVLLD